MAGRYTRESFVPELHPLVDAWPSMADWISDLERATRLLTLAIKRHDRDERRAWFESQRIACHALVLLTQRGIGSTVSTDEAFERYIASKRVHL
jgi:hypothetical protein